MELEGERSYKEGDKDTSSKAPPKCQTRMGEAVRFQGPTNWKVSKTPRGWFKYQFHFFTSVFNTPFLRYME